MIFKAKSFPVFYILIAKPMYVDDIRRYHAFFLIFDGSREIVWLAEEYKAQA